MTNFRELVASNEDWLMERILQYAKDREYAKYTSTLKEAWRLSIAELSTALLSTIGTDCPSLEFGPDDDFTADPAAAFGMIEARRHRERGVSLSMFLGLMKYYRQSYQDLVDKAGFDPAYNRRCANLVERFFDRVEIAFCVEWASSDQDKLIHELQDRNRAMTNEKNLYLTVFESHPYFVFVLDKEGHIAGMNHVAASRFESHTVPGARYYGKLIGNSSHRPGITCDYADSSDASKIHMEKIFPWIANEFEGFVESTTVNRSFEKQVDVLDGTNYFNVTLSRILDVSEKYSGVLLVLEDVTERKKLEESLVEKTNRLETAYKDLKETQAIIIQQEKMASIGQLAAGIAHEINNPMGYVNSNLVSLSDYIKDLFTLLTAYRNLLPVLKDTLVETGPVADHMQRIRHLESEIDVDFVFQDTPSLIKESREGAERIKKIVQDLKDFAHPGNRELRYADINKNLDSTLNIVWNELKYKAKVEKHFGILPEVQCYPQELNQVFMNLLVNAAQAIQREGNIIISTCVDKGHVGVRISDTGIGIPEENLSRIFDPFFTTKEVGKGTGLGLNVAYNIIKKHKGTIGVESTIGKGTTVIVRIPIERLN
ncbi:MAG: hypothetical protein KJ687_01785 [Proteobacteria bacterium]|nr:hypothetical protein [Pseudomonadota bacterium]